MVKQYDWTVNSASRKYKIPRTTLRDHIRNENLKKVGREQTLTESEEEELVDWIRSSAKMGDPRTKLEIKEAAGAILKQAADPNRTFKNGNPTKSWTNSFLSRHPEVSSDLFQKTYEDPIPTKSFFENIFANLKEKFVEEELLGLTGDSSRWLIFDLSEFELNLVKKGVKNAKRIVRHRVQTSVNFGFSADGNVFSPTILFPERFNGMSEIEDTLKR